MFPNYEAQQCSHNDGEHSFSLLSKRKAKACRGPEWVSELRQSAPETDAVHVSAVEPEVLNTTKTQGKLIQHTNHNTIKILSQTLGTRRASRVRIVNCR